MDCQIAAEVMDERLQRLQEALNRDQLAFNQASVGRRCQVLVERKGKFAGQVLGKTPWLQSAIIATEASIGAMLEVEITAGGPKSLTAVERVGATA
jgi:tRNA-2-methylthio-N6-dimethylallyladenosine synthase